LKTVLLETFVEESICLGDLLLLEGFLGVVKHVLYVGALAGILKVKKDLLGRELIDRWRILIGSAP